MKTPVTPPQSEFTSFAKEFLGIALCFLAIIAILMLTGCGSLTQAGPGGTSVVNTNQLNFDCGTAQGIVQGAAVAALSLPQTSATARTVINDIQLALGGVISGATTNSPTQLASLISSKASTEATLSAALSPLISLLSGWEQSALQTYSANNQLIITKAFAKAISTGCANATALVPAK